MPQSAAPSTSQEGHVATFDVVRRLGPRQAFVLLLGAAVTVQVIQALITQRRLDPYKASYWFVSYREGFTRRGLAGEILRQIAGPVPSLATAEVTQGLLTFTLAGALCVLLVKALRRDEAALDLAVIALCCSPFVFDFITFQRRPDQLGFAVVVAYGLLLLKWPERAVAVALATGLLLAFAVAVADSVLLACVPWVIVITVLSARKKMRSFGTMVRIALVAGPPLAMAIISSALGRLDGAEVSALASVGDKFHWGRNTVFSFLADDFTASLDNVRGLARSTLLGSAAISVLLILVQGALMLGFKKPNLRKPDSDRGSFLIVCVAIFGCVIALAGLLALSTDWVRWFAAFGLMGGVTATFGLLFREPTTRDRSYRFPTVAVIIVATYLLWLARLDDNMGLRKVVWHLFMA